MAKLKAFWELNSYDYFILKKDLDEVLSDKRDHVTILQKRQSGDDYVAKVAHNMADYTVGKNDEVIPVKTHVV